jgi:hypothetical protein
MRSCLSEESLHAYFDGELMADARDGVAAHLTRCADCAARALEVEQALAAFARALDEELPAVIPTARIRARIESALAESEAPKITVASLLGGYRQWSSWKLAAVAAGILILISAMAIFWQSESPLKPKREERAILPAPVNAPDSRAAPPKLTEPPGSRDQVVAQQPEKRRKRVRHQAVRNDPEEVEVVTRFFPLIEGDDFSSFKSNQIVRVELSGSALLALGLPVDGEMLKRSVKADVVLRHDGLARAIRFVHQRMPSSSIAGE